MLKNNVLPSDYDKVENKGIIYRINGTSKTINVINENDINNVTIIFFLIYYEYDNS
jgi:mRNA-degrading endonuclease HigB of HigAB toxin-antitoxin module